MTQNFFQRGQNYRGLDPRGMCIIQSESDLFLWVGSELPKANHDAYMTAAQRHIELLQRYERASKVIQYVRQDEESQLFWQTFGMEDRPENAYNRQ